MYVCIYTLESPLNSEGDLEGSRGSNQSILNDISPGISLEGMMLRLKLQYFGHLMRKSWLIGKDSDAGRDWGQEEKGTTEDEMAGWRHWLDGRESEWTPGVGDGQGGLACCDSWGRRESDMTERLNWTELVSSLWLVGFQARIHPLRDINTFWWKMWWCDSVTIIRYQPEREGK